jgi:hypothetical protein
MSKKHAEKKQHFHPPIGPPVEHVLAALHEPGVDQGDAEAMEEEDGHEARAAE